MKNYFSFVILISYGMVFDSLSSPTSSKKGSRCDSDQFMCHNLKCIQQNRRCDGHVDCSDHSDEVGCDLTCRDDQYKCANKRCIPKSWVCDGYNDCSDNSDEKNCIDKVCHRRNEFQCHNKNCIPIHWRCDGHVDCSFDGTDKSDELDCGTCKPSQFTCFKSKECISQAWLCDSEIDCSDGSDEQNCTSTCSKNDFTCKNGRCIDAKWKCDLANDCGDKSDEDTFCPESNSTCRPMFFKCSSKHCIPTHWVCDGDHDCRDDDHSDEEPPACNSENKVLCSPNLFQCKSETSNTLTRCINMNWRCDGVRDCTDGTDEEGCDPFRSSNSTRNKSQKNPDALDFHRNNVKPLHNDDEKCAGKNFRCEPQSQQCINESFVCDGKQDCANGRDEPIHCNRNECMLDNTNFCSHKCKDLKIGYKCGCRDGYKLDRNNFTCNDFNECLVFGQCSQGCVNRKGSFKCICEKGYQLVAKNRCKARGDKMFLLFPDKDTIRKLLVKNPMHFHLVKTDLSGAVGISYFAMKGFVYWSDMKEKQIAMIDLNNPHKKEEIIANELGHPEGLAVDWLAKNLYWADIKHNQIQVSDLKGNYRLTLLSTGTKQPRNIVVDPRHGHWSLYFTIWGESAHIERISMDGDKNTRVIFYSHNQSWPNCLCIDYYTNALYWIDSKRGTLELKSLLTNGNGDSQHKVIYKMVANQPYGLTVFEDYVYWTDWVTNAIHRVDKFGRGKDEKLISELYRPMGIAAFHIMLQPSAKNPCATAKCNQLCLLSQTRGYRCACQDGVILLADNVTCSTKDHSVCRPGYCESGGTCKVVKRGNEMIPVCSCDAEHAGRRCEIYEVPLVKEFNKSGEFVRYRCTNVYCLHGGTCLEIANNETLVTPQCSCPRNYYGKRCSRYTQLFSEHTVINKDGSSQTRETIIGVIVGVFFVSSAFAFLAYWVQRRNSPPMAYYNPDYRDLTPSEEDQLEMIAEENEAESQL